MLLSKMGIRLLVNDFQKCFDFYTQKLGFNVFWGDRCGPFAAFTADGKTEPCFSIFLGKNLNLYKGYTSLKGSGRTDQAVYVIPTDDVDEDYKKLKGINVNFIGEPQTIKEWRMRCVYLRDPEGNLFELCQEKGIE